MEAADYRHKRLMKQTSAWDLTCSSSRSGSIKTNNESRQTVVMSGRHGHPPRASSLTNSDLAQYQLIMRSGPFVAPPPSFAWNELSPDKQLQALLATATRAATTLNNNSNYSTDLVAPLEWLQGPRKLDLTRPPSLANSLDDATKLYPMTISTSRFDSSFNHHQSQQHLHHHNGDHQQQQTSTTPYSLYSSSPVSSTGSSRSSSTESINLSLTKSFVPKVDATSAGLTPSSRRPVEPFSVALSTSASSSSSGNSSDGDYIGAGDIVNDAASGALDARVDRRARKKDQNRRAAYNYRRKKMEERDRMIEEEARLVHKHVRMAGKIARLETKILQLLDSKTAKIFDKDGRILCYSCPICLEHTCENIQTLRNHLKARHVPQDELNEPGDASLAGCCDGHPSHLDATTGTTVTATVGEEGDIGALDDDDEYDSCNDSDETNNRNYVDLYNDCDAKFVIYASLSGDVDDNNNIKNSLSF